MIKNWGVESGNEANGVLVATITRTNGKIFYMYHNRAHDNTLNLFLHNVTKIDLTFVNNGLTCRFSLLIYRFQIRATCNSRKFYIVNKRYAFTCK